MEDLTTDEPIEPVKGSFDPRRMSAGEPALPRRFAWRGEEHLVGRVLRSWKETGQCRTGADEQYVRRHCYTVRTTRGKEMDIYFVRQPSSPRSKSERWWVRVAREAGPT